MMIILPHARFVLLFVFLENELVFEKKSDQSDDQNRSDQFYSNSSHFCSILSLQTVQISVWKEYSRFRTKNQWKVLQFAKNLLL